MEQRITRIFLHPLKSGGSLEVSAARVAGLGLVGDRRWMLVEASGRPLTQREVPGLAHLRPAVHPAGRETATGEGAEVDDPEVRRALEAGRAMQTRLTLRTPGRDPLRVEAPGTSASEVATELWGAAVRGRDAGEEAATWLNSALGVPCRLLHLPAAWARPSSRGADPAPETPTAFTDGFPFHFVSDASLWELNRRLDRPVGAERFRPSFVVTAEDPHAEDAWRRLRIGDVTLHVVKPCPRCSIPAVDPETGTRGKEPTRTLARYRAHAGKVYFGQNAVHAGRGVIRVGDPVRVLERAAPRPPPGGPS